MTNIMIPSEKANREQLGKVLDHTGVGLSKVMFPKDLIQEVIEHHLDRLVPDMVATVSRYVQLASNPVIRRVTMKEKNEKADQPSKYDRSPEEAIAATRRTKLLDDFAVMSMPRVNGPDMVDLTFFPVYHPIDEDEAMREYEAHDLMPAPPYLVAAANEEDQLFADNHPNITMWMNNRHWNLMQFSRAGNGDRVVVVCRCSRGKFGAPLWYAGIPKPK